MTDNEIIKALECHKSKSLLDCEKCPLYAKKVGFEKCHIELFDSLYDLINRQKAEIERLNAIIDAIEDHFNPLPFKNNFDSYIVKIESEARKEFAERIKEECGVIDGYTIVDKLLAEMENKTMNEERCIMCGEIIPEGRQICSICEEQGFEKSTSETTRIITLRVTHIGDTNRFKSKEEQAALLQRVLKYALNADDVTVDNVQDFIIDKGGEIK